MLYAAVLPTEPGFYWFEHDQLDVRPVIVEVAPDATQTLFAFYPGNSGGTPVSEMTYGRWAGPLLEPTNASGDRQNIAALDAIIRDAQRKIDEIQAQPRPERAPVR